jgi:threonylcarbamoyladenosine tRNA methylthiotransferase MtaB
MACRFCIIPQVRGRSRSVIPDEILSRVRRLTEGGFGEVVLTGIHLSSYGRDLRPRSSLRELVRAMDGLDGDFRVRLSSLDPRLMPPSLLDVLTRSRRTSPHFHLSLQHGADRILRAMGRESTAAEYRSLLAALSDRASEAAIGADIIVGFPGETEDDFEATATLVRDAPLSYVHVFSFSPRPGTPAALLGQVDEATKKRRAARLRVISKQKSLQFRRRFLGRILEGIVVRSSTAGGRVLTANYVDLVVPPRRTRVGAAVRVRINAVNGGETAGEIVSDE